ncbi:MAG: YeiH family protein, partial [Planctomycetota bacterium]
TEPGKSRFSDLWKKEDYWAIWLGFLLLMAGVVIYLPRGPKGMKETVFRAEATLSAEKARAPFKTIAWYRADDSIKKLKATDTHAGKWIKGFTGKPHGWKSNPLDAFFLSEENAKARGEAAVAKHDPEGKARSAAEALSKAKGAEKEAQIAGFKDEALNKGAAEAIGAWRAAKNKASGAKKKAKSKAFVQWPHLLGLMAAMAVFFGIGTAAMGRSLPKFLLGFVFVFFIAVLAYTAAGQATMKHLGIGYAAWAILFGLIISNTVGTPRWVKPAVQTEYFIKTGLVLLGAEILFGKILQIGIPGIFVAWVVTPIVLTGTYLFGQKILKIPSKTLNITISADMSVCGVSAAIATAAACRAKKEELTLAVGLSLIFTSVMMIVMPLFIKAVDIPHVLGGAWMGGTIDATGAVAAAGAFLSDQALNVAATIKMIQNVLIGVIAFCVALYWCARVECVEGQRVSAMEIWHRFPKFVIGFILASIAFSLLTGFLGYGEGYALVDHGVIRGMSKIFRGWFFCLAFVSIGLATNFRELKEHFRGGKPLVLYICGQSFNLMLTLTMAYIMFYIMFPHITKNI